MLLMQNHIRRQGKSTGHTKKYEKQCPTWNSMTTTKGAVTNAAATAIAAIVVVLVGGLTIWLCSAIASIASNV
jgi:hypothetical protein